MSGMSTFPLNVRVNDSMRRKLQCNYTWAPTAGWTSCCFDILRNISVTTQLSKGFDFTNTTRAEHSYKTFSWTWWSRHQTKSFPFSNSWLSSIHKQAASFCFLFFFVPYSQGTLKKVTKLAHFPLGYSFISKGQCQSIDHFTQTSACSTTRLSSFTEEIITGSSHGSQSVRSASLAHVDW